METGVIVAIITSVFSLVGVCVTVWSSNKQTRDKLTEQHTLQLYRIEQLENRVSEHNNLVNRMYRVEERLTVLENEVENDGK